MSDPEIAASDRSACLTPMSDHVACFWQYLATETVSILVHLKRGTAPNHYWDGSSFGDDVAKALVADREARLLTLTAKLEQAKAALKPFKRLAIEYPRTDDTFKPVRGHNLTFVDFRRARDTLANLEKE